MLKQDLALKDLKWLICHKTQPNQTQPMFDHFFFLILEVFLIIIISLKFIFYLKCFLLKWCNFFRYLTCGKKDFIIWIKLKSDIFEWTLLSVSVLGVEGF